jgi:hypothetical protein
MAETRTKSRGQSRKGKFTDAPDLLPSLFADPDGRGSRRWHEVFGRRPSSEKHEGGWLLAKKAAPPSSGEQ